MSPINDHWLYLSITTRHHKVVEKLNDDHWYESNSPPSRGSTPFYEEDDADLDECTVVYGLRIKEDAEYVFSTNPAADFRLDEPNRSSLLSDPQFKVFFNENRAWIIHDHSKNGTILNGIAMCSSKRRSKMAERGKQVEILDQLALRPDIWNDIDTLVWKLRIHVGHIQPVHPFNPSRINLSQLTVQYQSTISAQSEISEGVRRSDSLVDRYYHLDPEPESTTKLSLMRISNGKRHLGHLHHLKKSYVRENYQRCLALSSMVSNYDVLPYVDADVFEDSFVTVTEAWDGKLLEHACLDLKGITFLFAKLLRSIAFLHDQGFGCKISPDNILVKQTGRDEGKLSMHSLPIMTNVYIDLDYQIHPISQEAKNANLRALGFLIIGCLDEIKIEWKSTSIGQYLQACLATTQPEEQHLAHSLLKAMKIKRPEDLLWPFQAPIRIRRTFPLFWQKGEVRLKEIHDIIRACGAPRTPLIAPTSHIDGEEFLESEIATKLLWHHAIPDQLQYYSQNFHYTRNIFRHTASGLCNISQVLEICADWPLPDDFQTPATIREVRGSREWDGFYIDKANFDSVVTHLSKRCSLVLSNKSDLDKDHINSGFESIDHQYYVAIFTECSTPQLVQLSREVQSGSPSLNLQFPTVEECYTWFFQSGLTSQAEVIRKLKQPFQIDWTQIRVVRTTKSRLSESPDSPDRFRWSKRKSRLLQSKSEAFVQSSKLAVSQEILSWQDSIPHIGYDSDNSEASTIRFCEDEHENDSVELVDRRSDDEAPQLKHDQSPERKKSKTDTISSVTDTRVDRIPQQERDIIGNIQTDVTDEDLILHDTIELSQFQPEDREQTVEPEFCKIEQSDKLPANRITRRSHRPKSRQRKADEIWGLGRPVSSMRGRLKEQPRE